MIDGLDLVIDGDGHVIEVNETYERIDPKYRERRPVYTQASPRQYREARRRQGVGTRHGVRVRGRQR